MASFRQTSLYNINRLHDFCLLLTRAAGARQQAVVAQAHVIAQRPAGEARDFRQRTTLDDRIAPHFAKRRIARAVAVAQAPQVVGADGAGPAARIGEEPRGQFQFFISPSLSVLRSRIAVRISLYSALNVRGIWLRAARNAAASAIFSPSAKARLSMRST